MPEVDLWDEGLLAEVRRLAAMPMRRRDAEVFAISASAVTRRAGALVEAVLEERRARKGKKR